MKLDDYKVIFCVAGLIGVLLFASPTLSLVLHLPDGERFSELWILGPGHMAEDYPFNMGINGSYMVYVKFRNQTEPLPNSTAEAPSPLPPLYEYHVVVQEGKTWEAPLTFSFPHISRYENECLVEALTINDVMFTVDKPAMWDVNGTG